MYTENECKSHIWLLGKRWGFVSNEGGFIWTGEMRTLCTVGVSSLYTFTIYDRKRDFSSRGMFCRRVHLCIGRVRPPTPYPGAVATRSKFYFPIGRNWFCWVHGLTIPVLPRDNFKEWLFMSNEEADWLYKDMFCSLCSSEKYGVLLFMHDAQGRGFPNVVQASGYCMCNHKMRRAL